MRPRFLFRLQSTSPLKRFCSSVASSRKVTGCPGWPAGVLIGSLAVTESLEQVAATNIRCAVTDGVLSGNKLAVADGGIADVAVVLANGDKGPAMYLVELNAPGIERSPVSTVDPTRNTAQLSFDSAGAELLGIDGEGWEQLERLYDRAAVLFAFEQIGGAQAALDMAVNYARERYAFGRPIGSFQALKHMMADMYTSPDWLNPTVSQRPQHWRSSLTICPGGGNGAGGRYQSVSTLCQDNIQVHGGMGFTWEFDCHIYYRRSITRPWSWEA